MPKGVREELKAEKVVNGFSCRGMIHSIRPFLFFILSFTSKQPCSQLCEQKANIREKQKNITLVQFTVVQKGYKIEILFVCLI